MVAKISHGTNLYGALSYNHEKVFQGTAEILSGHRMISDRPGLPSEDMRLALLSFDGKQEDGQAGPAYRPQSGT